MMKYALTTFLTMTLWVAASAQQDTWQQNGKTWYVYPYQQELRTPMREFRMGLHKEEFITRDSINRHIVKSEVREVERYVPLEKGKDFRKHKKLFFALREKLPSAFYSYNLPLETDLVPVLTPLPDGDYVQFYRDLPYVDDQDVLRYRNDVVCAMFHLENNKLNGFAYWLTANGDTVKSGHFRDGLKEGAWTHYTYWSNPKKDEEPTFEGFASGLYNDTAIIRASYTNGLQDGRFERWRNDFCYQKGHFRNGKESGEWFFYSFKTITDGFMEKVTDEPVLVKHYTIPETPVRGKSVIVRNYIVDIGDIDREQFNIPYSRQFETFSSYYDLSPVESTEGIELPEEGFQSYPGEEREEEYYMDTEYVPETVEGLDLSFDRYENRFYINGKRYTRNDLIDSVGYLFHYDGIYEEYYTTGQLKFRMEIRNGNLVKEDTMFWENGKPASVVNFLPDSNQYEELVFDMDQQLIKHTIFDQKGNFLRVAGEQRRANTYLINGKLFEDIGLEAILLYENYDTLEHVLHDSVTLFESIWRYNQQPCITTIYNPGERLFTQKEYAINGLPVYENTIVFGEEFDNINQTELFTMGRLETNTQTNATWMPIFGSGDSLPQSRVANWQRSYAGPSDAVISYAGKPFSGKFRMTTHNDHFAIKSSPALIDIRYANGAKHQMDIRKATAKWNAKRKSTPLTPFITQETVFSGNVSHVFCTRLVPFLWGVIAPIDDDFFIDESKIDYEGSDDISTWKHLKEKKARSFDKTVEGQFRNGRPDGVWTTHNQFGQLTSTTPFKNGEIDGTVRIYDIAYPPAEAGSEFYPEYEQEPEFLQDSFPAKPVHYLARIETYKNGSLDGPWREMNWMGDTLVKYEFVDGNQEGEAMERTKIAYTHSNYEAGALDGITQTYLTIPGQDSVLLFDLNFQSGLLQGESKSYHKNGNLAKRGFFLMGQPIDDFEAFDTLGFRYQYVKFHYNQPIEEKIWEENQLSVRYTFDWRDSVYFHVSDIAGSSSIENMLYDLGLMGELYDRPYYGRPSVVDKSGISYHMTKYYPNDSIARDGDIEKGKKVGCWQFWNYDGRKLYEVDYADTLLKINDSVQFKSKGVLTFLDAGGNELSRSYIIEKVEKYDCSHTDHHEVRMFYTFWEKDTNQHRINGYVKNYYDNGSLMNEGYVKNGLATGVWKFYDPYGSLTMVGEYVMGKRQGRWLSGDLANVKYMGDICLNPNLHNLDEILSYQEKLLDISVLFYQMGVIRKTEYYGVNLNNGQAPDYFYGEEEGHRE